MFPKITGVDDLLTDEGFLDWCSNIDSEKASAWSQWIVENPQYQPYVNEAVLFLKKLNTIGDREISAEQTSAAFQSLQERLNSQTRVIRINSFKKNAAMVAAAIILLIAGTVFVYQYAAKPQAQTIQTNFGQLSEKLLPDGSQVTLNAHTELTLSKDWKKDNNRELWLKGEAFFHVKKTAAHTRFIVHTDQLDVIVTGTQFNVENVGDRTNVLLTEGSVTIRTKDGKEVFMHPGDFVSITGSVIQKKPVEVETVLAWRQNKIVFDNMTMYDVAKIIKQYYGVEVKMTDASIADKTISGVMPNGNLDVLLKSIEAVTGFKIDNSGKEVIISIASH